MNSGFIRSLMCTFGALALTALSYGTGAQQAPQPNDGAKSYQIACPAGQTHCVANPTSVRG